MPDEPRVGRKAFLFFLLGIAFAVFFPLLGFVAVALLAFAWIILVFLWVVSNTQVRRPVVYITAFTIGFLLILFLFSKLEITLFAAV